MPIENAKTCRLQKAALVRVLVCILPTIFVACGVTEAKPEAERLAADYYAVASSRSVIDVSQFYDSRFYQATPKEEWDRILSKVWERLGTPVDFELKTWYVNAVATTSTVGVIVTLQYDVTYEKYPATETFRMFKSASGGPMKIISHDIESTGLVLD